jgi:hypothetical protein
MKDGMGAPLLSQFAPEAFQIKGEHSANGP